MADHDRVSKASLSPTTGRRRFIEQLSRAFLGLWAVGGAGAIAAYLKAPERSEASTERMVRVGMTDDLRVGEARLIRHGLQPFYLVRVDLQRVIAVSAVCTHVRCILDYDRDRHGLVCPCHGGRFDLAGNVISGPPRRALPVYDVTTRAGDVFVRV